RPIIRSGLIANRPDPITGQVEFYYATNPAALWLSDGESWVEVIGGSGGGGGDTIPLSKFIIKKLADSPQVIGSSSSAFVLWPNMVEHQVGDGWFDGNPSTIFTIPTTGYYLINT